ncbi:MAG: FkbM family methyltransferase [Opitutae bacterium]|jgi:FkbM family methyltransferase|nr:FkbM family methyltransferase [Opitutae bacterium]
MLRKFFHRIHLLVSHKWFNTIEKDLGFLGIKDLGIVFDVGAHLGQTTLHFRKVFSSADVHSFEPISQNFDQLKINIRGRNRVYTNQFALGSSKGIEMIKIGDSDQTHSMYRNLQESVESKDETQKIRVETIDSYLSEHGIIGIDLLKIDVEGHELEVLKGADKTLKKHRIKVILAECDFSPQDKQHTYFNELWDFLRERNFSFFGLYDVIHYGRGSGIGYCNALFIEKTVFKERS